MPDVLLPLRNCKMVLCLPSGDGETMRQLRELGVPAVGLDADAAAVAACRREGFVAYAGSWPLLHGHRHAFDGAWVGLQDAPLEALLEALAETLLPGSRLVMQGVPVPAARAGDAFHVMARHDGWTELRRRPGPVLFGPAHAGHRVSPYADLFVGCKRVFELGAGCGQFLDALHLREVPCLGIEQDADLAAQGRDHGRDVRLGGLELLSSLPEEIDGVFAGPWLGTLPAEQQQLVLLACRHRLPKHGRLVVRCAKAAAEALRARLDDTLWTHVHTGSVPLDAHDGFVLALASAAPVAMPACPAAVPIATAELPLQQPLRSLFDLERFERRVHSQGGEDGVLEALFAHVGTTNRHYVEFGCGDGVQCNTAALRRQGWRGLLMDGVSAPGAPDADIHEAWITAENINTLLDEHGVPAEPDLLSIDVDGNDYWVWQAITRRPRVVVAEYNANLAADRALTIAYDPRHRWNGTSHYGASLLALVQVAQQKGYTLVYCTQAGVNAFFVRDDLLGSGPVVEPRLLCRPPNYWYRGARSAPDLSRVMVPV